jgi:hypothetical protein
MTIMPPLLYPAQCNDSNYIPISAPSSLSHEDEKISPTFQHHHDHNTSRNDILTRPVPVTPCRPPFEGRRTCLKKRAQPLISKPALTKEQQQQPTSHKRRCLQVRFKRGVDGAMLSQVHYIPPETEPETVEPVTPSPPSLWWLNEELVQSSLEDRAMVHEFSQREDYREAILMLMKSFKKHSPPVADHIRFLARNDCARGLEQRTVPFLKVCRKRAVLHILHHQAMLRGDTCLDADLLADLLREKSLHVSRPSRQLALKMGLVDRLSAKKEGMTRL